MFTKRGKLTQIDNAHIHPERLGREIRDVPHIVTQVTNRHNPVENGSPDARPGHEIAIDRGLVLRHDIEDRVIEQRNQTRDADDGQRLGCKDTEHHGCQGRREQGFINAKESVCPTVHVQCIRDGGE